MFFYCKKYIFNLGSTMSEVYIKTELKNYDYFTQILDL